MSLSSSATPAPRHKRWREALDNPYIRTFFIYLGLMLLASAYSNWQPLFLILNNMGAYGWICDDDSSHVNDFALCDEQYDYMSQIYSVAGNMAYIIGLVAGFLMDAVGGRTTMAVGALTVYTGWIMIIISSESLPLYWPGMICLGCAENLLGFPGFLAGKFWPMIQDLCASLCIAMQMLSSWVPAVIWALVKTSESASAGRDMLILYIVVCAIPAVFMVIATPGRSSHWILNPLRKKDDIKSISMDESSSSSDEIVRMNGFSNYKSLSYWKDFFRLCATLDFFLFNAWYVVLTLGFQFYNTKIMEHGGEEIGEFIGILNPFRAIIGPIMGAVSDYIGAWPMIIADNCFLTLGFGVSLLPGIGAQYTSAVFYILGRSFCFTTKYIYVQNFYPPEHFGKLSGIISFIGGTFGFLNVWFQVLPYDTQSEFAVCTVVSIVITTVPVYFLWKSHRNGQDGAASMMLPLASADHLEKGIISDDDSSSSDEV